MDLSADSRYLVTLSEETNPQVLSIWDCSSSSEKETPLYSAQVAASSTGTPAEPQTCVRFDTSDSMSLVTNGSSLVVFWSFHDGSLRFYAPSLSQRDFKQPVGRITQSVFVPGLHHAGEPHPSSGLHLALRRRLAARSSTVLALRPADQATSWLAVSATSDGDAMLWELVRSHGPGSEERRASKMVKLHSGPIHFLTVIGPYLVSGGADGHVRFFDFNFRVVAWFEVRIYLKQAHIYQVIVLAGLRAGTGI